MCQDHNGPQDRPKLNQINLMMRIELTQIATTLRFSDKFDHPFWHVFIIGDMFLESYGFVAEPVTSSKNFAFLHQLDWVKLEHMYLRQLVTDIYIYIYSNETVTLMKHITKQINIRKRMEEFLRKSESPGIKMTRVNSISFSKSINLL